MVNYKCPRCGYEINIKTKYVNHLRRKKLCKPILSEDDMGLEYIKYNITEKITSQLNGSKLTHSDSKLTHSGSKLTHSGSKLTDIQLKKFECKFCNKYYSKNSNLNRHLKKCKEREKDENDKNEILNLVNLLNKQLEEQKKELEKRNNQIDELIKKSGVNIRTQNIQNNHNNINILAYNNTDISHLTDTDYIRCLKHSNFCIPHLIKTIHFDPSKPHNHNIYISNLKNNYVMVFDGDKWNIRDCDESIQCLIDDKETIIEQKLEEWLDNSKNYPDIMRKFTRYLEKKENDSVLNKIKSDIKLMLFNNRNVVSTK
jgi:hypothetical protein